MNVRFEVEKIVASGHVGEDGLPHLYLHENQPTWRIVMVTEESGQETRHDAGVFVAYPSELEARRAAAQALRQAEEIVRAMLGSIRQEVARLGWVEDWGEVNNRYQRYAKPVQDGEEELPMVTDRERNHR